LNENVGNNAGFKALVNEIIDFRDLIEFHIDYTGEISADSFDGLDLFI